MKAATVYVPALCIVPLISIHAAREGGDKNTIAVLSGYTGFQSTPPVKAATLERKRIGAHVVISIHAAREGGDCGNE